MRINTKKYSRFFETGVKRRKTATPVTPEEHVETFEKKRKEFFRDSGSTTSETGAKKRDVLHSKQEGFSYYSYYSYIYK